MPKSAAAHSEIAGSTAAANRSRLSSTNWADLRRALQIAAEEGGYSASVGGVTITLPHGRFRQHQQAQRRAQPAVRSRPVGNASAGITGTAQSPSTSSAPVPASQVQVPSYGAQQLNNSRRRSQRRAQQRAERRKAEAVEGARLSLFRAAAERVLPAWRFERKSGL